MTSDDRPGGEAFTGDDERQMLDAIERWLEREVRPQVLKLEHADAYPHAMVEQMQEFGLFGATIAPEYGGLGMPTLDLRPDRRAISEVWMSLAGRVQLAPDDGGGRAALRHRSAEAALPAALCRGRAARRPRLTEPDCGSDLQAIRTRAVRDGDHYVINGTKSWITNASRARAWPCW